jgi:uncharacterized membrane protein YbaN (DUF454 family)
MRRMTRFVWVAGGTICVGLGIVGIFLPLLPTTPFLLLAAFFYSRGSERFHGWLLGNRWFGSYLRRYREHRSMTRPHKAFTLTLLWIGIGLSAGVVVSQWWARLLLAVVAVGVTAHILRLGTD